MIGRALVALTLCAVACSSKQPPSDAAPRAAPGPPRGSFGLTYYWLATQPLGDRGSTPLFTTDCREVVRVSEDFADELAMSGTGRLEDSRVIGVVGACGCPHSPCVRQLPSHLPWGVGQDNRPLVPFVSIAVDRDILPIGSRLYIEELDGVQLPSYFPSYHDGCVVADDTGKRITGDRVDWFVGRRGYYVELDALLRLERVTAYEGGARCP